jgi:glycosyltransferase involved in cell wall biosynthesis/MoaA/NifB/PqqE/SkfB family radical SAM enzyme
MKILKVIHGYPMRYNAGSEVYSQILCHELANNNEVHVFTREEDGFMPDYSMRSTLDGADHRIILHLLNLSTERNRLRYRHDEVDIIFKQLITKLLPDVIHIGHLNHLSTGIIEQANQQNIPIIFTLHDYWLVCPRGQFIQRNSKLPWEMCDGQEDNKCAFQCYTGNCSGLAQDQASEFNFWTNWVHNRMQHIREIVNKVDLFIAPSHYLLDRFVNDFGINQNKIRYLDYGFNLSRLQNRSRVKGELFTFGYIGTHIPSKGIQHLLQATAKLSGNFKLRIWGRTTDSTNNLKAMAAALGISSAVEWLPEYQNDNIVEDVFNNVDAIVVPSIWVENSPLVIHEAQQVRVPIITADTGGMKEYVKHQVNGLLFKHRDIDDLTLQMQKFIDEPERARMLGEQGYLYSTDKSIPDIKTHAKQIENIYHDIILQKSNKIPTKPGPWRITFDTNPDHCNYQCVMCECFSSHSSVLEERTQQGLAKRVMDINLIKKVLEEAKDTPLHEIIPSTMGEPLLYKEFEQIIELCKTYNLKLNLTTNGSFPRKGVEEWAKLIVPVTSDVKISWNGATKATQEAIMIGSKMETMLSNLKAFIKIRDDYAKQHGEYCRVTLQLTFLETNVHELPDIVKLGIELGVDRIKGHHLWAHFDEIKNLSMRKNKDSIQRWNNAVMATHKIANGHAIILENIDLLSEDATRNLAPEGTCPFLGKEAWVNTEGKFSPCCAPDKERIKLGSFGNLYEHSLEEIWQGDEYQRLRKTYMNNDLCVGCNMRKSMVA